MNAYNRAYATMTLLMILLIMFCEYWGIVHPELRLKQIYLKEISSAMVWKTKDL